MVPYDLQGDRGKKTLIMTRCDVLCIKFLKVFPILVTERWARS